MKRKLLALGLTAALSVGCSNGEGQPDSEIPTTTDSATTTTMAQPETWCERSFDESMSSLNEGYDIYALSAHMGVDPQRVADGQVGRIVCSEALFTEKIGSGVPVSVAAFTGTCLAIGVYTGNDKPPEMGVAYDELIAVCPAEE